MKKTLSFFAVLALLSGIVSCTQKSQNENSEITLTEPQFIDTGKAVVTVGTFGYVDPLFSDYTNKPTDIDIKIVNYSAGIDNDHTSKQNELDMAMLSGDAPDILCLSSDDMDRLNRKGALTDLYQLMDNGDQLKREDFLPCALEGMTVDGKLPAVMDSYYIYTAVAKTKFVPKEYENWTSDDAMKFYNEYSGKMDFYERSSTTSLTDYMLNVVGMSCIDRKNTVCDFSGKFTELLSFCKQNPVQVIPEPDYSKMSDEDWDEYNTERETKGLNDVQLVFPLRISGFDSDLRLNTYGFFNKEDLTFVGYPSENGCGVYITPNSPLFGICEQSGSKEAAWKLLSLMLKHQKKLEENVSDGTRGIPVLAEQLERDYNRPKSYKTSINCTLVGSIATGREPDEITQEYKDMLYDYILRVPADPYTPDSLRYMIDEEIKPVILDNRTPEQAAEILQNRIETYLSERN